MFWMGMLVGVFTMIFGKFLVVKLFGIAYRESYLPLILTIWTGIFISQAIARGIWMIGENLQRYRLFHNMVAVPLNIMLNLLLIPVYGVAGAATASLISVGVTTWFVPFLFKPMRISNKHLLSSLNPRYLLG
jgi:O-antigen/teichoic acid export membrane protein